ncbi:ABC transporter ATP-binding protein [Aeromonas caviae]|nr:ABC transporter ATP-binding protein [Aeromonas caviae]
MGPSGCGKSSLLAALAGVLPPGGPIRLTGDILLGTHRLTPLPPQERGVGILFQDDLLFAHLTVSENLMFGMPAHLKGMAARQTRAREALTEVGLEAQADKLPGALSGGQKARVSLLRALLAEPRALLLDEPFSRLDKPLRAAFRTLVFERLRTQAIPALLVTHDEEDAPGTILQLIPPAIPEEEHHLV